MRDANMPESEVIALRDSTFHEGNHEVCEKCLAWHERHIERAEGVCILIDSEGNEYRRDACRNDSCGAFLY